jgi:membrane-bound lytic murein transglycosylase A
MSREILSLTILGVLCAVAVVGATPTDPPAAAVRAGAATSGSAANSAAACPAEELVPPVDMAVVPAIAEEKRGSLVLSTWRDLPGWGIDNPAPAWAAFLKSCAALRTQREWQQVCNLAAAVPITAPDSTITKFFEQNFAPYQVINADGSDNGLVTGYYEPLLRGSRTPSVRHRFPLYAAPDDLITIDLSEVYPEFKNKRMRGRLVGNKVIPYHSRADIERDASVLKGRELVWVDDLVDVFFLHIQGSGRVQLQDGSTMRVGYADQNGHPFRSVARVLMERGELRLGQTSMQGIKAWARKNPDKVLAYLNENPSYVFFKELPSDLSGPIGTLGVPLTAERSIAIDPRVIPLGVPVYLTTTYPSSERPLNRIVLAQDTGGAINGGVRADFFWGFGDSAGEQAGVMKQRGKMWVLLPKEYQITSN